MSFLNKTSCSENLLPHQYHDLKKKGYSAVKSYTWYLISTHSLMVQWCVCVSLPLSRKTDDQQVVAFLPVAHMYQMFPEQERWTEKKKEVEEEEVEKVK